MRNNIVHIGADELTYEIREIVEVAEKFEQLGVQIHWENIGDPVAKGARLPSWMKDIVKLAVDDDTNFGYSPTKGLTDTREFLSKLRNGLGTSSELDPEDIIFFNGLGDAISKVYHYLRRPARVIGPSPAYSTHSSAEAAHAGSPHITYSLRPENNWLPDTTELRNKVKYNPQISGILIINPDNPTGILYPKNVLEEIVSIAKEYDLFLVSDEIYANIAYGKEPMVPLREVIDDVPALVMCGISKELPWPGARCGWLEVYNRDKDPMFARYVKTIIDAKMLEVCSTTLPQAVIPEIMSDNRYEEYLQEKRSEYKDRAQIAHDALSGVEGIIAPKTRGAFYMSVVFKDGVLNNKQKLKVESKEVSEYLEGIVNGIPLDRRFAYYLMAATGICVVPLSGFNSDLQGFRITLLESDEKRFKQTYKAVAEKIDEHLHS